MSLQIPFEDKTGDDYYNAVVKETISLPPQWDASTADFVASVSASIDCNV